MLIQKMNFVPKIYMSNVDGDKFSIMLMFFGIAGFENIYHPCKQAKNGMLETEMSKSMMLFSW